MPSLISKILDETANDACMSRMPYENSFGSFHGVGKQSQASLFVAQGAHSSTLLDKNLTGHLQKTHASFLGNVQDNESLTRCRASSSRLYASFLNNTKSLRRGRGSSFWDEVDRNEFRSKDEISSVNENPLRRSRRSSFWEKVDPNEVSPEDKALSTTNICVVFLGTAMSAIGMGVWLDKSAQLEENIAEREPPSAPEKGTITSTAQIWGLTVPQLSYGFMVANMSLLVMPMEAQILFPEHTSVALGGLFGLVSLSFPVGPILGRMSDSFKHPMGRRRPYVLASVQVALASTAGMWMCSELGWSYLYMAFLFTQQICWNSMNAVQTAIISDLVAPSHMAMASGVQTVTLLSGAVVGISTFELLANLDYHWNYAILMILSDALLPVFYIAADETPSDTLLLPDKLDLSEPGPAIASVYIFDFAGNPNFVLCLVERSVYYAAISCKAFMLFFIRDALDIATAPAQAVAIARIGLAGELSAAMMGAIMSVLFQRNILRPQTAASVGNVVMGVSVQFWITAMIMDYEVKERIMFVQTLIYGAGQGSYLAGDLALAMKTMPNPEEASRYFGLWGWSACIGGILGTGAVSSMIEIFGRIIPERRGWPVRPGSYDLHGYAAVLIFTFGCNMLTAYITSTIKTPEETENPQGGEEENPQTALPVEDQPPVDEWRD